MKKLVAIILIALGYHISGHGQLNDYKYIIVPTKFKDFKNENQFRTSTLVKYLFANEGFNTVYSNDLPEDLEQNPCLGIRVELIDESGLFTTKTRLSLSDCNSVVVMMSQDGKTKTKDLEQAYREAISESFGSFRGLNYTYEPKEEVKTSEPITISFKNDVMSLEEELDTTAKVDEVVKNSEPLKEPDISISQEQATTMGKDILYAQPIEGGYQLVDNAPKVIYVLKNTSAPDVFLVNKDGKNGVVFKNEGRWYIEMDEKGGKPKELNIKF